MTPRRARCTTPATTTPQRVSIAPARSTAGVYPLHLDRLDEALQLLDEVEGAVVDLFRRVAITTSTGIEAWAYEYCGETSSPRSPPATGSNAKEPRGRGDGACGTLWDSEVALTFPGQNRFKQVLQSFPVGRRRGIEWRGIS